MNLGEVVALVLLGAAVGFDTVSFPQAMLSRPIVAATLGGALMGSPLLGALCGAILECFALETLPVGASRYPEWGSSSVIGGALLAESQHASAGALLVAVVIGLAGAWLGGWSMVQLRSLNARRARRFHDEVARGDGRVIRRLQWSGLVSDFLRGAALSGVLLGLALPLRDAVARSWAFPLNETRPILAVLAAAVAAGAIWKHFSALPHARPIFLASLSVGLALYFLR